MSFPMADARSEVFHRFTTACQDDARIQAAFLGGSHGAGTADAYSDLDLYLFIADESYEDFFADRANFLRRLGEPVFQEDFNGFGFDLMAFILANGVDGELVLERSSRADNIQNGPFVPVVDRGGLLQERDFPIRLPSAAERADVLRMALLWFWRDIIHITRAIARDRPWTAYGYLEEMRHKCVDLLTLAQGRDEESPEPFVPVNGFAVLERVTYEAELALLRSSLGPLDRSALLASTRALIQIYQRLGPPLAKHHGLPYPNQLAALTLKQFDGMDAAMRGE
ncbi:MAG TPA: aminoglycoside 6-adenylyltransferase [Thermomicrobiales bacterium]|nr:aminoglycoside 6-adenylyltransferase [Thermomicrobiales bacterium]